MIDTKLGNRSVYLPRGRDLLEDLNILSDTIAASNADLFEQDGCIVWIASNQCVSVNLEVLREIVRIYVVTKHPRQTAEGWNVEYRPHEPNDPMLRTMLLAKTKADGALMPRLPKAITPHALSSQDRQVAQARLRAGEPAAQIAQAMDTNVSVIQRLAR